MLTISWEMRGSFHVSTLPRGLGRVLIFVRTDLRRTRAARSDFFFSPMLLVFG